MLLIPSIDIGQPADSALEASVVRFAGVFSCWSGLAATDWCDLHF